MNSLEIALSQDPDDARLDAVRAILREHNYALNPVFMQQRETAPAVPLVAIGLGPDRNVIGGLIGDTLGGWFRINIMAVHADFRRKGAGSQILRVAESEAVARGCERAFLDTMAYQGPEFYEACGYTRQCELIDWDSHGHSKYIYVKNLIQLSAK